MKYGFVSEWEFSASFWKIECDVLSDKDLHTLSLIAKEVLPQYSVTIGIPQGGLALARHMEKFTTHGPALIVDDVFTTGDSMNRMRNVCPDAHGLVIFARGPVPDWITPIFRMPNT